MADRNHKIVIKRAMFSCWDKSGIEELASSLAKSGVEIISSGGTANYLLERNIDVAKVEKVTGFPEILDGRVKTLHPFIHAAILAKRTKQHLDQLKKHDILPIDLVVINLYPFLEELKNNSRDLPEMVEFIDIGGPAMLRAAAKNFEYVVVLHKPEQYREFLATWKQNNGSIPREYSQKLSADTFFYSSYYDSQIASYLDSVCSNGELPSRQSQFFIKNQDLRYGENPHQKAAYYKSFDILPAKQFLIEQLWGKDMSYNNYVDVNAAYQLALEFDEPAVAIIKHTNPCGAAVADKLSSAFQLALETDYVSAFGGIIAANKRLDHETASLVVKSFYECVIAPEYSEESLQALRKKKNLRILLPKNTNNSSTGFEYRYIPFGMLMQQTDDLSLDDSLLKSVCMREPTENEQKDLRFAWKIVKHVKSNAIVFAKDGKLMGVGAGQMSRVDSVKLARQKAGEAGHDLKNAVMASDAFFPFRDGVDEAAAAGISAVIQPGGSIRDQEVVNAANEHNLSMLFTGIRHFKH